MKSVIFFLICFETSNLQKSYLIHNLESKNYFFHKTNFDIHTILNKLLASLNLKEGFMTSPNMEMLMSMHNYLEKIAERNCRVYEKLNTANDENIVKFRENNSNDYLDDVLEEEIEILKMNITKTSHNIQFKPDIEYNKTETNKTEEMVQKIDDLWTEAGDKTIENMSTVLNDNYDSNFAEQLSDNTTEIFHVQPWTSVSEEELETIETRRIYRGKNTKIKYYPFVVSIHLMSEYLCAGSIISSDMIISAASCLQIAYKNKVFRNDSRTIFVRMGSDYPKHSGAMVPVVEVIFHPQYDSVTLKNNLAILKILNKIKTNRNKKVKRIKYDKSARPLMDDVEDITIVGWGVRSAKHNVNSFQKLAVARLAIYDINDCKEVYSNSYVTDTNFCAGFTTKGGGACTGDVGGPAVVSAERELVGVVSFGPNVCGMPDAPTVFTKLGYYAEWINTIVKNQKSRHQRDNNKPTNGYSTPKTLVIPLYTTARTFLEPAPNQTTGVFEKTEDIFLTKEYPDEFIVLKKIFNDFILRNDTVLDYLTNTQIVKQESDSTKEEVDHKKTQYTKPKTELNRNNNTTKKPSKHTGSIKYNNKSNIRKPRVAQNSRPKDFDFTLSNVDYYNIKKTAAKQVDEGAKPQYGNFYNYEIEPYRPDESSSYYELEIPIDDAPFKSQPKSAHEYPTVITPSVDRRPRITRTVSPKAAVVKTVVPAFNNDIKLKSVSKGVIFYTSDNKRKSTVKTGNVVGKVKTDGQMAVRGVKPTTIIIDKLKKPMYPLGFAIDLSQDDFNYD